MSLCYRASATAVTAVAVFFVFIALLGGAHTRSDEPTRKSKLPITGKADAKYERFDDLLVGFLDKHKLPGAALAVAKDGELVYARGFGFADRDAKQPLQADALFRISSVSKPFTAAAVLKLIEQGKFELDSKVLDVLGLRLPPRSYDRRWQKITIRHLLEHRGGWDHSKNPDPMFISPTIVREMRTTHPATPATIIRYMLGKKLNFEPGEKFSYSNFGYCLLGRVIEKASGQKYEDYVKQHILKPLGITRMRLGRTLIIHRAPGEVRYHSKATATAVMGPLLGRQVLTPYGGYCLESMDSHAGWLASASDLVRFACAFADPKKCKVLKPESVESLFARPEGNTDAVYYAKGWIVRPFAKDKMSVWHEGTIDGSSCMLVRRADGVTFAILFNARQKVGKTEAIAAIELPLHLAANAIFSEKK